MVAGGGLGSQPGKAMLCRITLLALSAFLFGGAIASAQQTLSREEENAIARDFFALLPMLTRRGGVARILPNTPTRRWLKKRCKANWSS
jgi:hypothetical protein